MSDTITVLHAIDGRACKVFSSDGVQAYRAGLNFSFEERTIATMEDLWALLIECEPDPSASIIRGRRRSHIRANAIVRRRYNGPEATFEGQRTEFFCVDVDDVTAPDGIDPCSLKAVETVIGLLPPEFANVSYIVQFSNSAGTERAGRKIKAHLWFRGVRPYTDDELRAWAKITTVADFHLYNPIQIHYVARPTFLCGTTDPFEEKSRLHLVPKECETVDVRLPLPSEGATSPRGYAGERRSSEALSEIIRDDEGKAVDGREELLRHIRWQELKDGHALSLGGFQGRVWRKFQEQAVTGPTQLSESVYTEASVAERCKRDWELHGEVVPEAPAPTLIAAEAREQLASTLQASLRSPGVFAIKGSAGLGKSISAAKELIALDGIENMFVEYYVPRKDEQQEVLRRLAREAELQGKGVFAQSIVGRSEGNCIKHELAQAVGKKGLPVGLTLCCNGIGQECEAFARCPYWEQFKNQGPGIRILNHAYLDKPRPENLTSPEIVVIDETFYNGLCRTDDVVGSKDIGCCTGFRLLDLVISESETILILKELQEALQNQAVLQTLRSRGVEPSYLRDAAATLSKYREFPNLTPVSGAAQVEERVASSSYPIGSTILRLLRALARELETGRDVSHVVRALGDGQFKVCTRSHVSRFENVPTIILLDADLEERCIQPFFPELIVTEIFARENRTVIQVEDRANGMGFFGLIEGQEVDQDKVEAIAEFIRRQAGLRKLVITYKGLRPYLEPLLPGVEFAHFQALRGSNAWEECDVVFIVGRQFLPSLAIEDRGRALFYDSESPLIFSDPILRRYACGRTVLKSYDEVDPRLQAIRRTTREAETRQALARVRTVHCVSPKTVFLLSSQPTGVKVDRVIRFAPNKSERLWTMLGGYLPSRWQDLFRLAPTAFGAQTAARNWASGGGESRAALKDILMGGPTFVAETGYRPHGSSARWSKVLVDPVHHPRPDISLAKLLDAEVKALEWEPDDIDELPSDLDGIKAWLVDCRSITDPGSGRKAFSVGIGARQQ